MSFSTSKLITAITIPVVNDLPEAPETGSLEAWRQSDGTAARHAVLELSGENLTGGVDVLGWNATRSKWVSVVQLDGGDDIDLTNDRGWPLYDLAALYTHLIVRAGAGAASGFLRLLEVCGDL